MPTNEATYTYTKKELIDLSLAFKVMAVKILEPPFDRGIHILAIAEFHTELRKISPNTLWKGTKEPTHDDR